MGTDEVVKKVLKESAEEVYIPPSLRKFYDKANRQMALTEKDYTDTKSSLNVIRQYSDDLKDGKILKWLNIIAFAAESIMRIFFKDGKPKTKLQIALSIPSIIRFASQLIRMINGETLKKGTPKSLEQTTDDAIKSATNSRLKK